jgi:hypothetical protein
VPTGLNKTTVLRAIKSGRISGTRDEQGQWQVEPVELHRVFPAVAEQRGDSDAMPRDATARAVQAEQRRADLKAMLDDMRRQRDDMKADRDRWRDQADAWREQAQASQKQLTDQRAREPQSLWRWLRSTG